MDFNGAAQNIWNGSYILVAFILVGLSAFVSRPKGDAGFRWGLFLGGLIGTAIFMALMFNLGRLRTLGDTLLSWFGL